ncbi:diguanylate cyclase domain-containing protein [Frateuria defendens]|uniref:diguanylate cyclase domain-containing protein n=1 Tax=Frateuria defendens TaxID=2219559 RepID=UPI00066FC0D5|nr:diguanylate cyclase [Frateuria defendens]
MTAQPKILVVDDTRANLVAMRRLLADCGAELVEAGSGNEALSLCLDHRFALILLDVNMPGMDGFEVASLLGETEQLKDTPVIFVTAAYGDDLNRLKGYRSGAVDYIAKPINDTILTAKVRVFLDLYNARMQLQQALDELAERNRQLQAEVAERLRAEEQVRHQATHDMLTGLPNRMLFHERLQAALLRGARHAHGFALALLDIDGFKAVNDTHGHPTGDALLQAIAARLRQQVRGNDTVARLGGDEFALILEDIDELPPLLERCRKLCAVLGEPYALRGPQGDVLVHVGASLGLAPCRDGATGDEALIRAADRALYQAKAEGKGRCVLAA